MDGKTTKKIREIKAVKENKMDAPVSRFVKAYSKQANDKLKQIYLETNVKLVKTYIPYVEKCSHIESLILATCFRDGRIENGYYRNKSTQYMLYIMLMINLYTNVNIEYQNSDNLLTDQYDQLKEYGLDEYLINLIPKSEISEFQTILKTKNDDAYVNNGSIEAVIERSVHNMTSNVLSPIVDEITNMMKDVTKEDILKTFMMYQKS